jgi:E3 ubiquitin-protein ligase RNF5
MISKEEFEKNKENNLKEKEILEEEKNKEKENLEEEKSKEVFECNICFEQAQEPVITVCGHLYCI